MDMPRCPEDLELKNIIDKLAQFVAKNGIEFEQITKQKQRDNSKFNFLSGGEFYNYYQFKLNSERAILRQKSMEQLQQHQQNLNSIQQNLNSIHQSMTPSQQHPQSSIFNQPPNSMPQFNSHVHQQQSSILSNQQQANSQAAFAAVLVQQKAQSQINELQDQIRQSLDNLNAQHQMLTNQQQMLVDEAIRKIQDENLIKLSHDFNLNLHEFELVLHPIFETCTKDSISSGKNWISTRCHLPVHYEIICKYFLKRIRSPGMSDIQKVHLLYLINDLFNHCVRKNIESLKQTLTSVVVPIYCLTYMGSDEENKHRLLKLQKIWETNNYLDRSIIEQLKNPQISLSNYQQALCNDYSNLVAPITAGTMAKFNQLQQQHNDFVNHQNSKIQQLQVSTSLSTGLSMQHPVNTVSQQGGPFLSSTHSSLPPFNQNPPSAPVLSMLQPNQLLNTTLPPNIPPSSMPPASVGHSLSHHLAYVQSQNNIQPNPHIFNNTQLPPPLQSNPPNLIQQQPPPQLPPTNLSSNLIANQQFSEQQPEVPYYELPAGLMVPLVKLEDFNYSEIDPKDIKLPLPAPPNERLIRAVEEFYSGPSNDKIRNTEGWTMLGLSEFYKLKSQAKKDLEDFEQLKKGHKKVPDGFSIKDSRSKSSSPSRTRAKESSGSSRSSNSKNSSSRRSGSSKKKKRKRRRSYSSSSSSSVNSSDYYSNKKYSSDSRSSRSSSRGRSYKSSRSSSKKYRSRSRSYSPKNR